MFHQKLNLFKIIFKTTSVHSIIILLLENLKNAGMDIYDNDDRSRSNHRILLFSASPTHLQWINWTSNTFLI